MGEGADAGDLGHPLAVVETDLKGTLILPSKLFAWLSPSTSVNTQSSEKTSTFTPPTQKDFKPFTSSWLAIADALPLAHATAVPTALAPTAL